MNGSGAGGNYCLYRIFIVLGILTIVVSTVVSALIFPDGSQMPLYIGIGTVAIFMVILVGYWAVQIVFLGYGSIKALDLTQKPDPNDLSILKNWDTLFTAMVTDGGDVEQMKKSAKKGNSSLVIWFLWAAVIALGPIAMMVPFALGFLDWSYIRYLVIGYLGIVIFMLFLTVFLGGRTIKAGEQVMLEPLGLKLTQLPNVEYSGMGSRVRGGTVMEGNRFGRHVQVILEMGQVTTQIHFPSSEFTVRELQAEQGAPKAVTNALYKLRQAKRWDSLYITGSQDGITAIRNTKGQNMWLYDLWLIERIIKEFQIQQ